MQTEIAENIRKVRELRNISQTSMAEQLNISQKAYSKMETGETKINYNRLQQIAKILELDLNDLVNDSEKSIYIYSETNHNQGDGVVVTKEANINIKEIIEPYQKHIDHLEKEIVYLRDLLSKK